MSLLISRSDLDEGLTDCRRRQLWIHINKAAQSWGDTLLLAEGLYHFSYRERLKRIEGVQAEGLANRNEVLKAYPDTAMIIELKQEEPSIIDNFVQVVRDNDATDKITGSSEDVAVLEGLRAAAPEIAIATTIMRHTGMPA